MRTKRLEEFWAASGKAERDRSSKRAGDHIHRRQIERSYKARKVVLIIAA